MVQLRHSKCGMTLIELLLVVAIISLLLQLALPAIESAREAARNVSCQNNLRQLGLATQLHLDTHKHYPTGGWSSVWVGDPNHGFGKSQPGGWCYNLLPYLENADLHDKGMSAADAERRIAAAEMFGTPVPVFVCPSRRLARPWRFNRALFNSIKPDKAGRSDYAANMGSLEPSDQRGPGPRTYEEARQWVIGVDRLRNWVGWQQNGIVFQRSTVTSSSIVDGISKTYLIGEKFLAPKYYKSGKSDGDDQSLYIGFDRDNSRSTNRLHPPLRDIDIESAWLPEGDSNRVITWNFGSAHQTSLNMVLCDGSVTHLSYDVDIEVFIANGSRNSGELAGR